MKKNTFLLYIAVVLIVIPPAFAQQKSSQLLGFAPSITVEPYYKNGEIDINILPLLYQKPLTSQIDFRLHSIVNLAVRTEGLVLSHLGAELALVIFLTQQKSSTQISQGFYVAPVIAATRNNLEKHQNISLSLEPGYLMVLDEHVGLSIGVQFGSTHFSYDNSSTQWQNHFAVRTGVGLWL